MTILSIENAPAVNTIRSIAHPEYGIVKFNFKGQPLNDGEYTHTWTGARGGSILAEHEFKYWEVIS